MSSNFSFHIQKCELFNIRRLQYKHSHTYSRTFNINALFFIRAWN